MSIIISESAYAKSISGCRGPRVLQKKRYPEDAKADGWGVWQHTKLAIFRTNERTMVAALVGLQNISLPLGFNATAMFGIQGDTISEYWNPTVTDFFYVPHRMREKFISLALHFVREHTQCEIATAQILGIMTGNRPEDFEVVSGIYAMRKEQVERGLQKSGFPNLANWVHPIKLSMFSSAVMEWWMALQC